MIVLDIATDGLESPLEICVLDLDDSLEITRERTWVLPLPGGASDREREAYLASMPDRVRELHVANGLLAECLGMDHFCTGSSGVLALRLATLKEVARFVLLARDNTGVSEMPEYDRQFVSDELWGAFARDWVDLGTLDIIARQWYGLEHGLPDGCRPRSRRDYRARSDAMRTLKKLRYARQRLLSPYRKGAGS